MINNFKTIGNNVLTHDGYFQEDLLEEEKNIIYIRRQTLVPRRKKNALERAVCINFDLDNQTFKFSLDKEIDSDQETRNHFNAFKLGAPKDKKKFLITNNIDCFYNKVFSESKEYIEAKLMRSTTPQFQWFEKNIKDEYVKFLSTILNIFYFQVDQNYYLNPDNLIQEQKEIYNRIKISLETQTTRQISVEEMYHRLINKLYLNRDSKNSDKFPSIFMARFNGKLITEIDSLKNSYLNIVFYDLFKRFFIEEKPCKSHCHICATDTNVIGKIPLPMKFYGVTNELFFQNLSNKNAMRSFAICENCLRDILTGMRYVQDDLRDYLFDMNCIVIPELPDGSEFVGNEYKSILRIIKKEKKGYQDDIQELKALQRRCSKQHLKFNLMFYFQDKQAFDILRYISNIDLGGFIKKLKFFDYYSSSYSLSVLNDALTFMDMRYYLFSSFKSDKNPDYKVFGKALLNFIESFFNNEKISYHQIIHSFIKIFKKRLHNKMTSNADLNISPFKTIIFLTILSDLHLLKGAGMKQGASITEVLKKEYVDFFETHKAVYKDNNYRQGLFLLGTIVSKINYAQSKGERKKTILSKLNYEALSARRVPQFLNKIRDFASIYKGKFYEEVGIWGNITDRLQGIETSGMKSDEVIFYILSGFSYDEYLGKKFGMNKKNQDNSKGEPNE